MDSTCTIDGCEGRVVARGYCRKHYTRWHKYGDPLSPLQRRSRIADEDEWFWAHVDKSAGPDACWPWTGGKTKAGYGNCRHSAGSRLAHRVAFFLTYGYMPESADHECHNSDPDCPGGITDPHRLCCNPAHSVDRPRPVNASRGKKTRRFCKQGHEFPEGDKRWGNYRCEICFRAHRAKVEEANRAERAKTGPGPGRKAQPTCANGHPWRDGSYYVSGKSRKCRECHLAADAKIRQARREARAAGLPWPPPKNVDACAKGHPWVEGSYYTSGVHRKCRICHLAEGKALRDRRRSERTQAAAAGITAD